MTYTDQDIQFLKDNYACNGIAFCASHLKRTKGAVAAKATQLGLKVLREFHNQRIGKANSKPKPPMLDESRKVNPNNFVNITTPEASYILGILWADGCVTHDKIIIECLLSDMEDVKDTFLKTGNWKVKIRNRKNCKPQMAIACYNAPLSEFLINNNYRTKGIDSACQILSKIPEHLKHYWFRGLIDGDGHISSSANEQSWKNRRVSISGPFDQSWTYLENLCKQYNIHYKITKLKKISKKSGKISRSSNFEIFRKQSLYDFLSYVYQNREKDSIGFSRKFIRWETIKKQMESIQNNNHHSLIKIKQFGKS